jgi:pimeloyl-ACP methyl ester carboxylesterase
MFMENKTLNNNGVNISYTKSGQGQSIIFVHGNMGSKKHFAEMHNLFSSNFTVYTPDTRSHGNSDKVKRLNYNDIADDIAELIKQEQMQTPIFYGFSDGGIVGLLLAIKHRAILKKLFVSGINLTPKGVKPLWQFLIRLLFCLTFTDKMRLVMKQPNITAEQLKTIETPTTIFYAEKDIVKRIDSQIVVDNVKGSKLVFVPKENHASYVFDNKKLYNLLVKEIEK